MGLDWDSIIAENLCRITPEGILVHPGLPAAWGGLVAISVVLVGVWGIYTPTGAMVSMAGAVQRREEKRLLFRLSPRLSRLVAGLLASPLLLTMLKFISVGFFLLVIWAGLAGSPFPTRNLATVLTWNLWWSGVIVSVFFIGSAWCAICPWNALASWLTRRRLWNRADENSSLGLRVPAFLRNVWPALALFLALTWLELGVGVTTSPYATALVALVMLLLAVAALVVFERKAFCRFACPVGRTIGFYSQLAPVELRPKDTKICADCSTLECYHGSDSVDPCPTHQVMGRMTQNTFCASCGNCVRSCPSENVGWRLRPPSHEAMQSARPHWDEAWFMLLLLAMTGFHGLTMMAFFEKWMRALAWLIGDSGRLLWSFSIGMAVAIALPVALYLAAVRLTGFFLGDKTPFRSLFASFTFATLPLAFAYHIAHNLAHLLREGIGAGAVFANPLGVGALPLSIEQRHARMSEMALAPTTLAAIQALLIALGFLVAVMVIRRRSADLINKASGTARLSGTAKTAGGKSGALWPVAPLFIFAALMTGYHLWLLMQPMIMRG